jgi:hypothetical protein
VISFSAINAASQRPVLITQERNFGISLLVWNSPQANPEATAWAKNVLPVES